MKMLNLLIALLLIGLPIFASAYLTGLFCRLAQRGQRGVPWYFSLLGALGAGGFYCLLFWVGFLFQHGQLPGEFAVWPFLSEWLPVFILPPAVIITWYYRRKSRNKS
jgi:hypothetical protein